MNSVVIKFFGPIRDVVGEEELRCEISAEATGATVFDGLCNQYPDLHRWRPAVRLAVNLEYASFDQRIRSGDEVSIIPPVSGG